MDKQIYAWWDDLSQSTVFSGSPMDVAAYSALRDTDGLALFVNNRPASTADLAAFTVIQEAAAKAAAVSRGTLGRIHDEIRETWEETMCFPTEVTVWNTMKRQWVHFSADDLAMIRAVGRQRAALEAEEGVPG